MSVPIRLRQGSAILENEPMFVAEPMWDDVNSRLGVHNGRAATAMEWYPVVIGDKLIMNPNQTLGGKIANGTENNLYLDFSVQDQINIKKRDTGATLATLGAAASTFNSIVGVNPPNLGMINKAINGNLSVPRSVFPVYFDTNIQRSTLIAPNWQMWKTEATSGRMIVQHFTSHAGYGPIAGLSNFLNVQVLHAPNSSGIRYILHNGAAFRNTQITVSWWVLCLTVGVLNPWRISGPNNSSIASGAIISNGGWQRISHTLTMPNDDSDWFAIDAMYNPGVGVWYVEGMQVEYGPGPSNFEQRPYNIEKALCDGSYREGAKWLKDSSDIQYVDLGNMPYTKIQAEEASGKAVSVANLSQHGGTIQVPTLTSGSIVKYCGYSLPTTDETA